MINHIISECSKLGQKEYNTRQDWVGEGNPLGVVKKFGFEPTNKRHM